MSGLYCSFPTCTCGALKRFLELQEIDHLMIQLLMGLNDSYRTVQIQILLIKPLPPMTRAYSFLLQDERQRSLHSLSTINQAAMDASQVATSSHISNCFQGRKPFYHCDFCGRDGHSKSVSFLIMIFILRIWSYINGA